MDTKASAAATYAATDLGKSVGFCVIEGDGGLRRARDAASGQSARVGADKIIFVADRELRQEEISRAREQAEGMDFGSLWRLAGGSPASVEELARRLTGEEDDYSKFLASCAYLRERPLFRRVADGVLTPVEREIAEKIIASRKERERLQAEQAKLAERVARGDLTMISPGEVDSVLFDRKSPAGKMIDSHCARSGIGKPEFLLRHGLLESELDYHRRWVLHHFGYDDSQGADAAPRACPPLPEVADASAVSADRAGTSEIDDAITFKAGGDGCAAVMAHVCFPALQIMAGDELDVIARSRMSTIYMPQEKLTMLPAGAYRALSLTEGEARVAVTVGAEIDLASGEVSPIPPALGCLRIAKNSFFDDVADDRTLADLGIPDETAASQVVAALRKRRGFVAEAPPRIRRTVSVAPEGVSVTCKRAGIAEEVVSEMMIYANATLSSLAKESGVPIIYRRKGSSSASPGQQQHMGYASYGWFTSPLRRYADMVNQRQVAGLLCPEASGPILARRDLAQLAPEFDRRHADVLQAQRKLDRFWILRHILDAEGRVWTADTDQEWIKIRELMIRASLTGERRKPGERIRVMAKKIDLYSLSALFEEAS